ncbi:MAG: DUF6291 domain-containing protein [Candidatus Fonsibacter sp.]
MADNKKGFVLYADQRSIVDMLPNEKAGELLKHIFAYVNDENPISPDPLVNLAFEPIKLQLKRDLKRWEDTRSQRSKAGQISAEKRKQQNQQMLTHVESVEQTPTKSTVIDNVNVKVNVIDNIYTPPSFDFKKSLLSFGFDSKLVSEWIKVRKAKKLTNTETALDKFIKQVELTGLDKNLVLEKCVEKSWGGFESSWITNATVQQNNNQVKVLGTTADGEVVTDQYVYSVYKQMGKL